MEVWLKVVIGPNPRFGGHGDGDVVMKVFDVDGDISARFALDVDPAQHQDVTPECVADTAAGLFHTWHRHGDLWEVRSVEVVPPPES